MKMVVKRGMSSFTFSLGQITQLCGQNIPLKTYIIDSVCKHFSSEKYMEYEENMVENVLIDNAVPGRKMWECYRIGSIEDMISIIQIGKKSVFSKVIKEYLNNFESQTELLEIDNILLKLINRMNSELLADNKLEIQYESEELLSMIATMSVKTNDGRDMHELSNFEIVNEFLKMIDRYQQEIPDKRMIVFENIDHILSIDEYSEVVNVCEKMTTYSNVWFVFCTSIDGYLYCSEEMLENINVINEEVFSLGTMDLLMEYVEDNYPTDKKLTKTDIINDLSNIIQKIGADNNFQSPEEQVILKLINHSLGVKSQWKNNPKIPEIQYLLA